MKLAGLEKGLWWSQESKRVVSPWEETVRNGSAGASGQTHWVRDISELKRSHRRGGHSVHSVIDLVFVGIQAFGGVHVLPDALGHLLHVLQLAGVWSGPPQQCSLRNRNKKTFNSPFLVIAPFRAF